MDAETVARLRRADFWTALVLLALAGLMARGALEFPIADSYGGVANAWYVSPALFPLLVAAALALLSVVLLINAIRTGGARAALTAAAHPRLRLTAKQKKLGLMVLLLVGYVYGIVPAVDYVVGTTYFLLTFVAAFHLEDEPARRTSALLFVVPALLLAVASGAAVLPGSGTSGALGLDLAALGLLVLTAGTLVSRLGAGHPQLRTTFATALVAPTLLAMVFKYGLLVPLPREGLVVSLMDQVRYALRAAMG